ncbi:sugar ABC transporter ATP-binding protein [Leifsonia aquatica]|uniref:ABC-type sugar transport system ATPase subunit n=2 Tax=Leifsonia aquatica TaxID=144185 RepID=A0A7W4UX57_LEIAQ|nr:sugar ABC transporter ATP-binding protein [Leifsonia aquatica]ERK71432.1 putative L-arabinose ABC transporter, ATP-binding protein AraG [Leifsonia aquatica ATCC 14665]MBB2967722.1 ABC-type sugar transport system ATPase subunit [Leifsonia aquatica]
MTLPTPDAAQPAIRITGLSRRFGPVTALADVTMEVPEGRVTALLGENGAGKSTLLKILAGLQPPSAGSVTVHGVEVQRFDPHSLLTDHGVAIVPQELSLLPERTVAENILVGVEPGSRWFPSRRRMRQRAAELLRTLDLDLDPAAPVGGLDLATQQLVVVARSIARGCRILILDEPTSVLTPAESERLFALMETLTRQGTTLLYVSHRMPEVFRLADQLEVLRDGRHVASWSREETTPEQAVAAMVGRELGDLARRSDTVRAEPLVGPVLTVRDLAGRGHREVSFDLHPGEILGIAGLPDSGRVELLRNLFGAERGAGGRMMLDGRSYDRRTPGESVRRRLGFVPGERRAQGLLSSLGVGDNIGVLTLGRHTSGGLVRRGGFDREAGRLATALTVKTASLQTPIVNLSGGNQQKAMLARWLAIEPRVLILDEPTRGVDVGAKAEIYEQLFALAAAGVAILCSSSDLPELLTITDRIAVMAEGRIATVLPTAEATEENIMAAATGAAAVA